MQPRSLGIYVALLIAAAGARPQYYDGYDNNDYDYDHYHEEEYDPPEFTIESKHLVAREGETVIIPCPSERSEPYVMLILRDTARNPLLFAGEVHVAPNRRYRLVDGSLEISDLEPSDSGGYICAFSVGPSSQERVELTHTLDVQFAPVIRTDPEQQLWLPKGGSATLKCEAYGNPEPLITWSKLEGRLPSGSDREEGTSITLEDVDRHVEGNYMCTAINGIGDGASKTFTISVEFAPEVISEEESITIDIGYEVELACLVYANPAAVVTWTKDGQPLSSDKMSGEQGGHRHTVWIPHMTQDDFGTYVCRAQNLIGESSTAIYVTERSQQVEEEEGSQLIEEEGGQPVEEERGHESMTQEGHPVEEERDHEIMAEKGQPIEEERGHEIVDERNRPIEAEWGHDIMTEGGHPIEEERDHHIVDEGGHPIEEERDHHIVDEGGHPIEEERDHHIVDDGSHPIEEERDHHIMEEGGHPIEEERIHQIEEERIPQIMAERDHSTGKKKGARGRDLEKWIIITTNLARLLGKMWGKL